METQPEIIFEEMQGEGGDLGIITLNRPHALNALTQKMIQALDQQLIFWAASPTIKAVVIRAVAGRAFCAGGDIRSVYERALARDITIPSYFADEYRMNLRIYHFPKPYIALMDGITMGGGVGVSLHGSHRVATKRFVFAMPETSIGFYPDVGGTYFLPRLPHKIGFYLGLSGARISYNDCLTLGMVDHVVEQNSLIDIIKQLADTSFEKQGDARISDILNQFHCVTEESELVKNKLAIQTCFSKDTIENILAALKQYPSAWCEEVAAEMNKKSPTSLKVTLRQLQEGEKLTFDDCMRLEYRLTNHFLSNHDFIEGIRAVIIDKDQKPRWRPATLEDITHTDLNNYFSPLHDTEELL